MKLILAILLSFMACSTSLGQSTDAAAAPLYNGNDPLTMISNDVARTAKAVEAMSRSWAQFVKAFSSNQGQIFDEQQRKLILALEVLNRFEVSMANMQKLRLDLTDRQSSVRMKLAAVTDDLQPQSIEKSVALRGTTDAEGLRTNRRQTLEKEFRELTQLMAQIGRELTTTDIEIRRLEMQIKGLRDQIFGEAERLLSN